MFWHMIITVQSDRLLLFGFQLLCMCQGLPEPCVSEKERLDEILEFKISRDKMEAFLGCALLCMVGTPSPACP